MAAKRHMSDNDIETICKTITRWPDWKPFGWEALRQEIKIVLKFSDLSEVWTRQGLEKVANVYDAYTNKKLAIRKSKSKSIEVDKEVNPVEQKLLERIKDLEAEKKLLESENDRLHEQFELWLYNAVSSGLTIKALERPLPVSSKDQK